MLANRILQAATVIEQGGIIAYSTDTVLGLGCDPDNREAVEKILWLKHRGIEKGLILLTENIAAMQRFTPPLSTAQCRQITASLAGAPTTWVVPAKSTVPVWITGAHDSVALRIPQHPVAGRLCAAAGAIVSTSANVSGYPTATGAGQLRDWFGPHLDYVVTGPAGTGVPSEVRELMGMKVHRHST